MRICDNFLVNAIFMVNIPCSEKSNNIVSPINKINKSWHVGIDFPWRLVYFSNRISNNGTEKYYSDVMSENQDKSLAGKMFFFRSQPTLLWKDLKGPLQASRLLSTTVVLLGWCFTIFFIEVACNYNKNKDKLF